MSDEAKEPTDDEEAHELSDDELDQAAGGYCVAMDQPNPGQ
jgi:hypothetical protein